MDCGVTVLTDISRSMMNQKAPSAASCHFLELYLKLDFSVDNCWENILLSDYFDLEVKAFEIREKPGRGHLKNSPEPIIFSIFNFFFCK